MGKETVVALLRRAVEQAWNADEKFSALLTKYFGRKAVERRYSDERSDWPLDLVIAAERRRIATARERALWDLARREGIA